MMRISIAVAALLFIATAASADTGVCSGGTADPFFYATTVGNTATIHFESAKYAQSMFNTTVAANLSKNNTITIQQSSAEPTSSVAPVCATGSVTIPNVPQGTWDVVWALSAKAEIPPFVTFLFTLDLPPVTTIGPCSGGPADPFYSVTFAPVTLHSESKVFAYHLESLQIDGREITVRERETVSGVAPPFRPPCQNESIPLTGLPPGTYHVTLQYYTFVGVPPPLAEMGAGPTQPETPAMTRYFTFTVPSRQRAVRH